MKTIKHIFTMLLLLCATIATAHDFKVGRIYYSVTSSTNQTVEVTYRGTSYSSYSNEYTGSVVIPESITYSRVTFRVTSIGGSAFEDCTGLTSIVIPNSVTSIGNYAFRGCTGLTGIEIPDSVTSIGDYAFYGCAGLTGIEIPNSVTSIGWNAFENCSGLASIEIPNSVTSIGRSAFGSCTGLTSIIVATGNANYDSRDNCNAIIKTATNTLVAGCKNTLIPNSVTSIEKSAFYGCSSLTSVVIPSSVTSIGDDAFRGCTGLKTVYNFSNLTFSKGSTGNGYIAYYADNVYNLPEGFIENDLVLGKVDGINTLLYYLGNATELTLPADYKGESYIIGADVFKGNTTIKSIVIPNSVTSIGESAFEDCTGLTSVVIGNSVTSIGDYAFSGCTGLTSVEIGNSVTSIGDYAFYYCSGLTSIVIPNSVTSIGNSAFYGCTGLTSVEIGNSVTSIGSSAFYKCTGLKTIYNLSNLTFSKGSSNNGYVAYYADKVYNAPNGSIEGDYIFGKPNDVNTLVGYLGNATELTLPADYKGENYVIGASVFKGNTTITSVVIPNSVTSIGRNAFSGCTGLTAVHISDLAAWCGIDFASASANPLYYAKNLYLNGEKLTELVIPDGVVEIKNYTFYNCTGLTSVVIPNSVTSIGNSAFYGCTGLKTIYNFSKLTFSKGSTGNGYVAYYANKVYNAPNGSIEGDYIFGKPNNVNTLLYYLGNATEPTLPADYKGENYTIGASVFKGNTTMTSIEIPNSVISIGLSGFEGCSNVETLYIGSSIESIGSKAFAGCEKITEIKVALEKPIRGSNDIFASAVYDNATLYVPNGAQYLYENTAPWNNFNIVEMDFTGIAEIAEQRAEGENVYYDLSGRVVENPTKGVYIINGKKVFVK